MARPKREVTMARSASAALLAAIEIYNKPTVEYREQTFAMLMANAWEVLLKARIVQQCSGKLASVYRSENGRYVRDRDTQEPITIGLREALTRTSLPAEVAANIHGIMVVRNSATHMGTLAPELAQRVLGFGTASILNFVKLTAHWFAIRVQVPYLLPIGFLGEATMSTGNYPKPQRELLAVLEQLGRSPVQPPESEFAVVMRFDINLNRRLMGGGNIGITNDPSAPQVRVSDTEALERYPATYDDLIKACAMRYPDLRRNRDFYRTLAGIKRDPRCVYERLLDPYNPKGAKKALYNLEATLAKLDEVYDHSN